MWMGIIMMAVIGPAIGNYATSVVYRLPLGQTPFEKHPYCGSCGTMLQPKDLFPIASYVLLRGRCRYCSVRIRPSFTIIEVACGVLFIAHFLAYGISETFLLYTAFGVFMMTLAALEYHQNRLYPLILTFCFFLAALPRAMDEQTIYPMVQSGFLIGMLAILIWRSVRVFQKDAPKHHPEATQYSVPDAVIMAFLIGIALPLAYAAAALPLALFLYLLFKILLGWRMVSAPTMLAILFAYAQQKLTLFAV